jgi:hypothetical protein
MTVDRYTRFVLTIIAACLVWLCVSHQAPAAYAQPAAQRVVVVGFETDGVAQSFGRVAVTGWVDTQGHLNTLPVSVSAIQGLPVHEFLNEPRPAGRGQ